jgi:hypothetical protein
MSGRSNPSGYWRRRRRDGEAELSLLYARNIVDSMYETLVDRKRYMTKYRCVPPSHPMGQEENSMVNCRYLM